MNLHDPLHMSIARWAENSDLVQALVQTGSLARNDGSADDLSDLDIEIISSDPDALMRDDGWLRDIGDVITVLRLDPDQDQEWATRLAIYADGTKVDFTLAGVARIRSMVEAGRLDELYERGYRILLDKTGVTAALSAASHGFPRPELPSQEEFQAAIEEFWFEANHIPKYLARGELWLVKQRDWTMKELMLRMLEWHATARNEVPVDVWHIGTRMRVWADPAAWREVHDTFGRFDAADARRAFDATVRLFGRLGREVADITGLVYPQSVEDRITALNQRILARIP